MPANNAEASSSRRQTKPYTKGTNSKHKKGNQPQNRNTDTSKLGVSKIKSMIRQASRLLQKEKIEPGLKVQTERRLESLKADLRRAELGNVEKKNHEKYHMVRFFERKKLLRIIKRAQNGLKSENTTSQARNEFENELFESRVMLNYILHYPMSQKYIALFAGVPEGKEATEEEERQLTLPPHFHSQPPSAEDKPAVTRMELLTKLKALMEDPTEAGKQGISLRPEETLKEDAAGRANKSVLHLDAAAETGAATTGSQAVEKDDEVVDEDDDFFE